MTDSTEQSPSETNTHSLTQLAKKFPAFYGI